VEIAARYLPMSSVAGDFYDFLVVDDEHVGILIADVSGHGLPSALIASMLQSALAGQYCHASDPAHVLSGLNRGLNGKFERHYVTAAYVFMDIKERTVSYGGAGHPPMLLWQAKHGRVFECTKNGLMLGPFADAAYSSVTMPLEQGDRIVLFTDGVMEAANSTGVQFGIDGVSKLLDSKRDLPLGRFADASLYALSSWSEDAIGAHPSDDITLLAVDFKAT
jgi:phosphoserine phosphatase RsbU/P